MNAIGSFGHEKCWENVIIWHQLINLINFIQWFSILFCLFVNGVDITHLIDDILSELGNNAKDGDTAVTEKENNDTPISKNGKLPPQNLRPSKAFKEAESSNFSERKYVAAKNSKYNTSSTKAVSIYLIMRSSVFSSVASKIRAAVL